MAPEAGLGYPVALDERGNRTAHPLIDCAGLADAIDGDAAGRIGQQMVSALIDRGYFFANADSVLPLALMEQTYAQMRVAHDDVPQAVKASMTGLERSRLCWSPQGNEDEYEPGTKATAQHWSFSRTGQRGRLGPPEADSLLEFDRFADRLYGVCARACACLCLCLRLCLRLYVCARERMRRTAALSESFPHQT